MRLDRISIEDSLRWVQHFVAREWQLVLPVALAFIALPSLVSTLALARWLTPVPQTMAEMQALVASLPSWLTPLWLACSIAMLAGGLVLTALALLPQVSVREAIAAGLQRLGATVAAALLIGVATMALLVAVGLIAAALRLPQGAQIAAAIVAMAAGAIFLLLLLPLIVDRRSGPIAALRAGGRFWRGNVPRLAIAIVLYISVTFVAALAIQVALGSMIIMLGTLAGSTELGQLVATVLTSAISAIQIGGLFLLTAAFYRLRVGRA